MLKALIGMVWSVLNTVLRAHIIKTFWAWFLLPLVPQAPVLNIWSALGLTFLIYAFIPLKSLTSAELEAAQDEKKYDAVTMQIVNNGVWTAGLAISYGLGWLLHHYM